MDHKKIRAVGAAVLVALWVLLTAFAWFGPRTEISESERRPLDQMPELSGKTLLDGTFMGKFEDFSLDQFPLRDTFRRIKSLWHYNVMRYADNNDIYVADGYAAKLEYPYRPESITYAAQRFQSLYEMYLRRSTGRIFMTVAPDKGYYLAEENGYLTMDYQAMFADLQKALPWATYVDLTDTLDQADYYTTDTHWRQEALLEASQKLCQAMGVGAFSQEELIRKTLERPFYGVYYGQAALPMDPEQMHYLTGEILEQCKVYDYETGGYAQVYDMTKLESKDLYDVFLSGSKSLLTIENPNAATDKELIVFRDSFGSSMVPLLVKDYAKVTLVDLRYIHMSMLKNFIQFKGQDVLLLYSTLVLNNSSTIK